MKLNDQNHPYVRKLVGCGHGVLFKDPCQDCEIVGLLGEYARAKKTMERTKKRLTELGEKVK